MVLKSLKINGFKSFAESKTINFVDGITGIIGPNGSGKSNLTEAVRWVMGEQSAKSLRGDKMQDIIFAGSTTRAPLNRAEVSLTFDNQQRQFSIEHDEVNVTRRLFRNGESEFMINNRKVRLKDVTNLFLDAGLGRHSLAIISQGNVEAIFNSKPEDRRFLIEEPAGVAGFKLKKKQAQQQLEQTDDNLQRVSDIVVELSRQVEPLKEQASIARDYQEQKQRFEELEQKILAFEINELTQEQLLLQEKQAQVKQELKALATKVDANNQNLKQNREDIAQLTSTIDNKQVELTQVSQELESLKGQKALSFERSGFNDDTKAQLQTEIDQLKTQRANSKKDLANQQVKLQQFQQQVAKLQQQLKLLSAQEANNPQTIAQQIEQLRQQNLTVLQQQSVLKNQIDYQTKQLETIDTQVQQLADKKQTSVAEQDDDEQELTQLHERQLDIDSQKQTQQEAVVAKEQQASQLQQTIEAAKENYYRQLRSYQTQQAQLQSLNKLIQQHQGFYQGVRAILNAKNQLQGIIGVVAELIQVPEAYQMAIQSAAGAQLQSIVTTDQTAARDAIAYLRQNRAGRATFLPQNVIKARKLNDYQYEAIAQADYFVGLASELISSDFEIQNIIDNLFGSLLVVRDIDSAIEAGNLLQHRFKIVTLQGDLINPGGSLTGGQNKNNSDLLSQQSQQKKLTQRYQIAKTKLMDSEKDIKTQQKQLAACQPEIQQAQAKLQQIVQASQDLQNQLQIKQQAKTVKTQQAQELSVQLTAKQQESKQLREQIQLAKQQLTLLSQQNEQQQADLKQQELSLQHFDQQQNDLTKQLQSCETDLVLAQNSEKNQAQLVQQIQQQLNSQDEHLQQSQAKLDKLINNQENLNDSLNDVQAKLEQLTKQQKIVEKDVVQLKKERQELQLQAQALDPAANRLFSQQSHWTTEQEQNSVKLAQINTQIRQSLTKLEQNYQLSIEAATKALPKNWEPTAAKREANLLKQGIAELGNVNLAAIDDYAQIKERYEFLTEQRADLLAARKQLQDTMAEMDAEVVQRFESMFEQVAAAFETIFPQMFGGGHAQLALTDPDDLLNTGLEIIVQPPGKKLQRLSLLSGGERALTATTLLFALLKVRPVPFCILDEVEASLDDANVERFAEFLNHYDDQTQFIVITHRKGTMMQVKQLYGVSMQESGVSTVLALDLSQSRGENNYGLV